MSDVVYGVTRLQDEVYILHVRDDKQVEVYSVIDYDLVRHISVPELKTNGVCDITSSEETKCLYLSNMAKDCKYGCIHVVAMKGNSSNYVFSKWELAESLERPCGLSVTSAGNLLVTCINSEKLVEYSPLGERVRTIILDPSIKQPYHSIQLSSGMFLCCHTSVSDHQSRVCVIDPTGKIQLSFGSTRGLSKGQLDVPAHIAVDEDGFVYVADRNNARVVLLSPSLQFVGVVLPNHLLCHTNHIYIDHTTKD